MDELLHNIAPGKYIVIKVENRLQLHFKMFFNKSDKTTEIINKILMIKTSNPMWLLIENWCKIHLHMKVIDTKCYGEVKFLFLS